MIKTDKVPALRELTFSWRSWKLSKQEMKSCTIMKIKMGTKKHGRGWSSKVFFEEMTFEVRPER